MERQVEMATMIPWALALLVLVLLVLVPQLIHVLLLQMAMAMVSEEGRWCGCS